VRSKPYIFRCRFALWRTQDLEKPIVKKEIACDDPASPVEAMAVTVLLADDSDIMRGAILRSFKDKPRIKAVAEAVSFAKIMQMRMHA
jgi:sulfate adenylyltransferase subunit 1 (EFTu-like GTPase family)